MATGKVLWFNNEKKYGFILIGEKQIFVHFSAILKEGYKTLKKGQTVECDVVMSPRGERALNVKVLPETPFSPRAESGEKEGRFSSSRGLPAK